MNKKILKIVIIAVVAVAIVAAIALTLTQGKGMSKSEIFDFVNNYHFKYEWLVSGVIMFPTYVILLSFATKNFLAVVSIV